MARLKLKQILSSLSYDENTRQLTLDRETTGSLYWDTYNEYWNSASLSWETSGSNPEYPAFIISGSVMISHAQNESGSLTIQGLDTFGDSGSFDTIDLGEY